MSEPQHSAEVYLERISKDMKLVREMLTTVITYMRDAESEVPEKVRRFINYWHDCHDVANLYVEHGHETPSWIKKELERCDDRFRQILDEMHTDGGAFEKVRRAMADDPQNRWDHTRLLDKPHKKGA